MADDKGYPYDVPYDDELFFYNGATLRVNPQGEARKAKCCPICNYPIHVRMVSSPCNHYFCYECYQKNTYSCGFCGSLNSKIDRIDDNAKMLSCDTICYKVFESQDKLYEHFRQHQLLKNQ